MCDKKQVLFRNTIVAGSTDRKAIEDKNWEVNTRAISLLTFRLKRTIATSQINLDPKELNYLLGLASAFTNSFSRLELFCTTPIPFPLVQLTKTLLFFWIFMLPFTIVQGVQNVQASALIMFMVRNIIYLIAYEIRWLNVKFANSLRMDSLVLNSLQWKWMIPLEVMQMIWILTFGPSRQYKILCI